MTSRTMTVRAQLGLLAALSCTVFVLALGGALWQMHSGDMRLSGFVDNELAAERDVAVVHRVGRVGARDTLPRCLLRERREAPDDDEYAAQHWPPPLAAGRHAHVHDA